MSLPLNPAGPPVAQPPRPPARYIQALQCPSNPGGDRGQPLNSYLANAGFYPHSGAGDLANVPSAKFPFKTLYRKANGVFTDKAQARRLGVVLDKVSMSDLKDGASNTALFSESLTAANWNEILPTYPMGQSAGAPVKSNLMVWLHVAENPLPTNVTARPNPVAGANLKPGPVLTHMRINYREPTVVPDFVETWRPSSSHPGGVIMGFADQSTKFISERIAYHVYQSLLTPDNVKSDMPVTYVLNDADFQQ